MSTSLQLINSGFSLIDKNWGGFYVGGSYLLIGPRKSGRTLLSLQFAKEAVHNSETCLFFTNMRPKDLMIQAASINFDIQESMNNNKVIVVRVSSPDDIYDTPNTDEYLIDYLNDIITVVKQYKPNRIIFDELTPYVGFDDIDLLEDAFLHTLEVIEDKDITSIFVIGEPATKRTQEIVDKVSQAVTANIQIKKDMKEEASGYKGGIVTIVPNIGHTQGVFSDEYIIEPNKGLQIIGEDKENNYEEELDKEIDFEIIPSIQKQKNEVKKTKIGMPTEQYYFSNLYTYNDFELLLSNQIALYKSTGKVFDLAVLYLDSSVQMRGLIAINQLKDIVKNSTGKKDKICVVENKILVLITGENKEGINLMLSNIENNIPIKDALYRRKVLSSIFMLSIEIGEEINSAERMLEAIADSSPNTQKSYVELSKYIQ